MGLFNEFWRAMTGGGPGDAGPAIEGEPGVDPRKDRPRKEPGEAYPSHAGRIGAVPTEMVDVTLNDDNPPTPTDRLPT